MASLSQTIRNGQQSLTTGADSHLQYGEQDQPSLSQLSGQQGLSSPPITPGGAAAIGATPDQAKMAGTPAQKAASLSQAVGASPILTQQAAQPNLSQTVREQQARSQQTGAEQQQQQSAQQLQGLSGISDRVNDFINAQRQSYETASTTASATPVAVSAASTYNGTDLTPISGVLQQLRADPTNMSLQLQVNQFLGRDANSVLQPSEIDSLYQTANDATAAGGQAATATQVTAADLIANPKFGYNANQLASMLGVDPATVSNMTVQQIGAQVNKLLSDEYSKSASTDKLAQSGELGTAEQGLAQQAGREASATGQREVEQGMQTLTQKVAQGDTVQFNGQAYTLEDLLKSGTISGVISNYLNAPDGSDVKTQLETNEPQLVDFIKQNQAALSTASQQLQSGATQFGAVQTANKAATKLGTGYMSTGLAQALGLGDGSLSATQTDTSNNSLYNYASALPAGQQDAARTNLEQLVQTDPGLINQLQGMSKAQLDKIGLNQVVGAGNQATPLAVFLANAPEVQQIRNASNPDDIAAAMGLGSAAQAQQVFQQMILAKSTGVSLSPTQEQLFNILYTNNNRDHEDQTSIGDWNQIKQAAVDRLGGNLYDAANSITSGSSLVSQGSLPASGGSYALLQQATGGTNAITADGASALASNGNVSYNQLKQLGQQAGAAGINVSQLAGAIQQKAWNEANASVSQLFQGQSAQDFFNSSVQSGTDPSKSIIAAVKQAATQYPEAKDKLKQYLDVMVPYFSDQSHYTSGGSFTTVDSNGNRVTAPASDRVRQQLYSQAGLA